MNKSTINRASEIIFANEGGYASVNADDNGAVSVGRIQWHGNRALNIVKKVCETLGDDMSKSILLDEFYAEITTTSSWATRTVTPSEATQLSTLLSTEASKQVQDAQAEADVTAYLVHIESLGVTDENALIFMADIENQGGAGASARIIGNSAGKDIDSLYASAKADSVFSNYVPRRDRVYQKLTGHPFGEQAYEGEIYEVKYGDTLSAIGAELGIPWREIAELNNITNPNLIRTGDLLKIPRISSTPEPEPTTQPETTAPVEDKQDTYTVQRGDTLSGIGAALGIPWREIAYINHIYAPYTIYIGQVLLIPIAKIEKPVNITYTVQRGDTLSAIAKEYNVSVDDIVKANSIADKNMIYVGQILAIPQ